MNIRKSQLRSVLVLAVALASQSACSLMPHYGKIEPVDHVSHLLKGPPVGPKSEEDTLTQSNLMLGWTGVLGSKSYLEFGLGWMWADRGFYGGPFTATVRAGKKLCFQREKCDE